MSIVYQFLTRRKVQVQDEEQTCDVGSDDDDASAPGVGRDITGLHSQLSLLQHQLPRQSHSNPCNSLVPAFLQKNSRGNQRIFRTPESHSCRIFNFFFFFSNFVFKIARNNRSKKKFLARIHFRNPSIKHNQNKDCVTLLWPCYLHLKVS